MQSTSLPTAQGRSTPDGQRAAVTSSASLCSSVSASPINPDSLPQRRLSGALQGSNPGSARVRHSGESSPAGSRYSPREGSTRRVDHFLRDSSRASPAVLDDGDGVGTSRSGSVVGGASLTGGDASQSPNGILVQRAGRRPTDPVHLTVQNFQDKLTRLIEVQPLSPFAGSRGSCGDSYGHHVNTSPNKRPRASGQSTTTPVLASPPPSTSDRATSSSTTVFASPTPARAQQHVATETFVASGMDAYAVGKSQAPPLPGPLVPPEVSMSTLSLFHQRPSADQMQLFAPGAAPGKVGSSAHRGTAVAEQMPSVGPLLTDLAELQAVSSDGRHWIGPPPAVAREDAVDDTAAGSPMHSTEEQRLCTSGDLRDPLEPVTWMQYALSKPVPQRRARSVTCTARMLIVILAVVPIAFCVLLLGLHFWALRYQIGEASTTYYPTVGTMTMPSFAFMMAVLLCFLIMASLSVVIGYGIVWRAHITPFVETMNHAKLAAQYFCEHQPLPDEYLSELASDVAARRPTFSFQWYASAVMASIVNANKMLSLLFAYTDEARLEQMMIIARARLDKPVHEAVEVNYHSKVDIVVPDVATTSCVVHHSSHCASEVEHGRGSTVPVSTSLTGDTVFSPSPPRSETPGRVHSPLQIAPLSASPEPSMGQTSASAASPIYANDAIQLGGTLHRDESPTPMLLSESPSNATLQRHFSGALTPARAAIISAGRGTTDEDDDRRMTPNYLYSQSAVRSPSMAFRQSASPGGYYDRDVQPEESMTLGASRFFENTTSNVFFPSTENKHQVSFLVCRLFLPPIGQTTEETTRKDLAEEIEKTTTEFYRALSTVAEATHGVLCEYQLDSALLTFNAFTPVTEVQLLPRATEAVSMLCDELNALWATRPSVKWGVCLHSGDALVSIGGSGSATYIASPEIAFAYAAVKLCLRLRVHVLSCTFQEPNHLFHCIFVDEVELDEKKGSIYAMEPPPLPDDLQGLTPEEEAATVRRFVWLVQGKPKLVLGDAYQAHSRHALRAVTIAQSMVNSDYHDAHYRRLFENWRVPEDDAVSCTVAQALRVMPQLTLHSPRTARPGTRSRTSSITAAALPRPPTLRPRSVSLLSSSVPRTVSTPLQHSGDYPSPSEGRELSGTTPFLRPRSRSATFLGSPQSISGAGHQSASFLPPVPSPDDASDQDFRLFSPPNIDATVENPALPLSVDQGPLRSTPLHRAPAAWSHHEREPSSDGDNSDSGWVAVTQNSANVTKAHADTPVKSTSEGFNFCADNVALLTVPPLNFSSLAEVVPTDPFTGSTSVNAASSSRFGGNRRASTATFLRRPSSTAFEESVRKSTQLRPRIVFRTQPSGAFDASRSAGSGFHSVSSALTNTSQATISMQLSSEASAVEKPTPFDYTIVAGDKIGEGTGGRVVFKGMDTRTNEMVAIKQVPLPESSKVTEDTQMEIDILVKLRDEHIVGYVGSCIQDPYLYIVMKFVAGGPLQKLLDTFGFLPMPVLRAYTRHILAALEYIHGQNVAHRDISANNVLVTTEGKCKLTDFGGAMENIVAQGDDDDDTSVSPLSPGGSSVSSHDSDDPRRRLARHSVEEVSDMLDLSSSSDPAVSRCDRSIFRTSAVRVRGKDNRERHVFGTPLYMSPQSCVGEVHLKNDIWSLGILFCQCASGHYPWDESQMCNRDEFISKVADGTFRPQLPLYAMSPEMADFAEKCLERNINRRWDATQLSKHSFMIG